MKQIQYLKFFLFDFNSDNDDSNNILRFKVMQLIDLKVD